jgi:hypothetical protein
MAWETTPKGIFDSDAAKQIGDALLTYLQERKKFCAEKE